MKAEINTLKYQTQKKLCRFGNSEVSQQKTKNTGIKEDLQILYIHKDRNSKIVYRNTELWNFVTDKEIPKNSE